MFFLSADDKLLVKTIRKAEFDLLLRLLPAYYDHMLAHPNSLLVKVFGLYSITAATYGGRKVNQGGGREAGEGREGEGGKWGWSPHCQHPVWNLQGPDMHALASAESHWSCPVSST